MSSPSSFQFESIAYNDSRYVAGSCDGSIFNSTDGVSWSMVSGPVALSFGILDITWGGSQFIAVDKFGYALTSADGTNWTASSSGAMNRLRSIDWNGSQYVAVGDNWAGSGVIIMSDDGRNWTDISLPSSPIMLDVISNGKKFIVGGVAGTILDLTSTPSSSPLPHPPQNNTLLLQVGANTNISFQVALVDARTSLLGINDIEVDTVDKAETAIIKIDNAIEAVSSTRSRFGAYQNALEHIASNVNNAENNLTAAESRIRDVDMAKEMTEFKKNDILQQSAQAMLAQANQPPQGILQLFDKYKAPNEINTILVACFYQAMQSTTHKNQIKTRQALYLKAL